MKQEDLLKRTKQELLSLAREKGLQLSSRLRKAELVDRVLTLFPRRGHTRATPKAGAKRKRTAPGRPPTPAARKRTSGSRVRSRPPATAPISTEELLRVSEEISRGFPRPFDRTEIVLLEVDPYHAHVFWHARLDDVESARRSLGPEGAEATLLMRFYDVTLLIFDGSNAHSAFDVAVDNLQSKTYIDFQESGRSYIVDLGLRARNGSFQTLARSNAVTLPRDAPSNSFDRAGLVVDSGINLVCEIADVTCAETLADIRPEPRPDMEPDTSDDLVRSFYRHLTDHNLPGPVRRRKPESRTRSIPEAGPGAMPGEASASIAPQETTAETGERRPPADAGRPAAITASGEERAAGRGDETEAARRGGPYPPAMGASPFMESRRTMAESSYGVYGAGVYRAGVSSWIAPTGGVSSWVTSPGAAPEGRAVLEEVFTLPGTEWKKPRSVSELSAELVIQGRAAPGADIVLFGERVRVRPDGTFSVRRRLPEGVMVVPLAQGPQMDKAGEPGEGAS